MKDPTRSRKWLYIVTFVFSVVTLIVATVGLSYGFATGTEQFWAWIMGYVAAAVYLYWLKLDREVGPWIDEKFFGNQKSKDK